MKTRYSAIALFSALIAISSAAAHASSSPAQVKSTIQALYDKENAAATNKDADGMLADVDHGFVGVDEKGNRITYADLVTNTQQLLQMASSISANTVVRSCKVSGNKAVLGVNDTIRIVVSAGDQGSTTMEDDDTSTDTWTKTPAGWRLTASRTLSHSVTINGQPAPDMPGT